MIESAATEPSRPTLRRSPAVLVVDDEADLRELLSLTLVRLGWMSTRPESCRARAHCWHVTRYALCLTDMRLPDGTGLELVREVAQNGAVRRSR